MRTLRCAIASAAISAFVGTAFFARAADAPYELNVLVPVSGAGAFLGNSYEEALTALES